MAIEAELGWAAGFIDGEGSITINRLSDPKKLRYRYRVRIVASNTDKRAIDYLCKVFGGAVYSYENKGRWKPRFCWNLNGEKALDFLESIYSYSVIKREQIEVALKFRGLMGSVFGNTRVSQSIIDQRNALVAQLNRLHQRNCGGII